MALGAIVTVGYFDLKDTKGSLVDGMHESVYELSEQVESLGTDLAKIRISQGNYESQKLLADMLVRCRLAERAVENFPVDGTDAQRLTAFFYTYIYLKKSLRRANSSPKRICTLWKATMRICRPCARPCPPS